MSKEALYYNLYIGVLLESLIIIAYVITRVKRSTSKAMEKRLFHNMAVCVALMFIGDFAWAYVDGRNFPAHLNWAANYLYYCAMAVVGYMWLRYVHVVMNTKIGKTSWWKTVIALPMIVQIIMTVSSYWTSWMFYIDAGNVYHRGQFHLVQTLVGYGYMGGSLLSIIFRVVKKENFAYRTKYMTMASFIVFPIVFGLVEIAVQGLPTLCMGLTLSAVTVYMGMLNESQTEDELTKIGNRNRFIQELTMRLTTKAPTDDLCVVAVHLQELGKINKVYGIDETDSILVEVAAAIRRVESGGKYLTARYKPSEFVMLCYDTYNIDMELVKLSIEKEIDKALASRPYHVYYSISGARYDDRINSVPKFMKMAEKEETIQ